MSDSKAFDKAQEALNRMRSASLRGTGCHLTSEMIKSLSLTMIGEMWNQDDPKQKNKN